MAGHPPLWRRVLTGPTPLGHVLAGVNIACFVIGIILGLATAHGATAFHLFWAPEWPVQLDMGISGAAPLAQSRVWTVLSAPFLHASPVHLYINMLCLVAIMPALEACFGRARAFIIYGTSGICSVLAPALSGEPYVFGASGAVCGLCGALAFHGIRHGGRTGRQMIIKSFKWAIINLLLGFTLLYSITSTSLAAGFSGGIVSAMILIYGHRWFPAAMLKLACSGFAGLTFLTLSAGIGMAASSAWLSHDDPRQTGLKSAGERANRRLLEDLNPLVALRPDNANAYLLRASVLIELKEYAAALPDLDRAIELGEDMPMLHNQRALALLKTGQPEKALGDIGIALRAEPENPFYLNTRALIHAALGRRADATHDDRLTGEP